MLNVHPGSSHPPGGTLGSGETSQWGRCQPGEAAVRLAGSCPSYPAAAPLSSRIFFQWCLVHEQFVSSSCDRE